MSTTRPSAPAAHRPDPSAERRARLATRLLAEHREQLRRLAARHGVHGPDAEDAIQSALLRFLASFDGDEELAFPWIALTLKRLCWRHHRTRARHPQTSFVDLAGNPDRGDEADLFPSEAADPAELVCLREEIDRQRATLQALPPEQRLAVTCAGLDMGHDEIAATTGWTPRQVRRYVQKGNAALADRT